MPRRSAVGPRSVTLLLAALVPVALVVAVALPPVDAGARDLADPSVLEPRPGSAVATGMTAVAVAVPAGSSDPQVEGPDGPVSAVLEDGVVRAEVDLTGGIDQLAAAVTVDGQRRELTWTVAAVTPAPQRIAGEDRIDTAVQAARTGWGGGAPGAVLARADSFADALAGSALAGHLGGPLLLTGSSDLDMRTAAVLTDLVVAGGQVHLLGGTEALAPAVATALADLGFDVRRHGGVDRFATAVEIAEVVPETSTALVASGTGFADAVSASAPAAARGWPLLLVTQDALPEATARAAAGFAELIVIGGPAAVSDDVVAALEELGPSVRRIAGDGRTETAARVAAELSGDAQDVVVASAGDFPDALSGGVLAAQVDAALLTIGAVADPPLVGGLATLEPEQVHLMGGEQAIDQRAMASVLATLADVAHSDGDLPPDPEVSPPAGSEADQPIRLGMAAGQSVADGAWSLTIDGQPVTARLDRGDDHSVSITTEQVPAGLPPGQPLDLRLTARLDGPGAATRHVDLTWTQTLVPPTTINAEGFEVLGGVDDVVGTGGTLFTYSVEVEPGTGEDVARVADIVQHWLEDTDRGWTVGGARRVQRVDAGARIRVVLASPATVDRYCGRVGLNTAGIYSCWDGQRALLNHMRWTNGAPPHFTDVDVYRGYLVNHEVGHGFGFGHVGCPAPGAPAPVMMQQTIRIGACQPNPYPHP